MKPDRREQTDAAFAAAWSDPARTQDLLRAIKRTKTNYLDDGVRTQLTAMNNETAELAQQVAKVIKLDSKTPAGPKIATLGYDKTVAETPKIDGDLARGEQLFSKLQCVNCHTVNKEDMPKGPYLGGIATRYSKAELMESILQPSKKITQGFETQLFIMDDGKTHEGFVSKESDTEIEIRNQQGNVLVIKKEELEERGKTRAIDHAQRFAGSTNTGRPRRDLEIPGITQGTVEARGSSRES